MGEQRKPLVTTSSVIPFSLEDILTADSEYMPQEPVSVGSSPTRVVIDMAR